MDQFIISNQAGDQIMDAEEWFKHAPPKKGIKQWCDGYSAKELAKSWTTGGPHVPLELEALFKSHEYTQRLTIERVMAEVKTDLDCFGGPRNHDLVLIGHDNKCQRIVACIEAKARESFGKIITEELRIAESKKSSNAPTRIHNLSKAIFGCEPNDHIKTLRYQLLYALAGTLIEAQRQNATMAVFIVHEFVDDASDSSVIANGQDFASFFHSFPGVTKDAFTLGQLYGPIQAACKVESCKVPTKLSCLFGKCQTIIPKYIGKNPASAVTR